jgi:nucleolar protein 4
LLDALSPFGHLTEVTLPLSVDNNRNHSVAQTDASTAHTDQATDSAANTTDDSSKPTTASATTAPISSGDGAKIRHRGFAFISFSRESEAQEALTAMNNKPVKPFKRSMQIAFAVSKESFLASKQPKNDETVEEGGDEHGEGVIGEEEQAMIDALVQEQMARDRQLSSEDQVTEGVVDEEHSDGNDSELVDEEQVDGSDREVDESNQESGSDDELAEISEEEAYDVQTDDELAINCEGESVSEDVSASVAEANSDQDDGIEVEMDLDEKQPTDDIEDGTTLFLRNIPFDATEEDVKEK